MDEYAKRLDETTSYLDAVIPLVAANPSLVRIITESNFALAQAYYAYFLRSLLASGARWRQKELKKHLCKNATREDQARIRTADLPSLIHEIKRRFSFSRHARSIDGMFRAVFGFAAWPSEDLRERILDLVRVRNLMIHESGVDLGLGKPGVAAAQLRKKEVLETTSYGEYTIYRIDHRRALLELFPDAYRALQSQMLYLRDELSKDASWDGPLFGED